MTKENANLPVKETDFLNIFPHEMSTVYSRCYDSVAVFVFCSVNPIVNLSSRYGQIKRLQIKYIYKEQGLSCKLLNKASQLVDKSGFF